ncbi:MAG: terminase small subunit [Acidiferrobacterales bacterium]
MANPNPSFVPKHKAKRDGVPRLSDKQFRVCIEYVNNGYDKKNALLAAGYSSKVAAANTASVFKLPQVKMFIAKHRQELVDTKALDREWVVSRFMELVEASKMMSKFKMVDKDGTLYWDFRGATEKELKHIHGLSMEFYTEGRGEVARDVKKFKVNDLDPYNALMALARIEGLFNDKLKLEGDMDIVKKLQEGRNRAKPPPSPSSEDDPDK